MRSLLFVALLVATLAVASGVRVTDADDQALMEIGVDLTHRVDPTPTYTNTRPAGHEDPLIAKFPMLHEIQGLEKQDWNDIQGLLFREPPSAAESNVDMKLDELEEKFNKLDTLPIPSSVAPKGSTLLPSLKKPELGLRATLPKALAPRLQQVKAAPAAAPKAAAPAPVAAKAAPAPVAAKPAAPAPAAAKPAAAKPAAVPAAKPAAPAKPLTVDQEKAAEESKKKGEELVRGTVATVRLIEKRMKGLSNLIQRLKSQIGLKTEETQTSAQRLTAALNKHRKDKADLAKRMAARKTSLMEVDSAHEQAAEVEQETEVEADSETETETEGASDIASVINTEVEGEQEAETDAEAQLDADAEAVDSIIDSLL